MKTFKEWSQHYGYDPKSSEVQADYKLYKEQLAFFHSLAANKATTKEQKDVA